MNKTIWIIVAVLAIFIMLVAGLLPLPGQKDNVTPSTQPGSPTSSAPAVPTGPSEKPATGAEALKQQPK